MVIARQANKLQQLVGEALMLIIEIVTPSAKDTPTTAVTKPAVKPAITSAQQDEVKLRNRLLSLLDKDSKSPARR